MLVIHVELDSRVGTDRLFAVASDEFCQVLVVEWPNTKRDQLVDGFTQQITARKTQNCRNVLRHFSYFPRLVKNIQKYCRCLLVKQPSFYLFLHLRLNMNSAIVLHLLDELQIIVEIVKHDHHQHLSL